MLFNEFFRGKSNADIDWVTRGKSGNQIHFLLDGIDLPKVVAKQNFDGRPVYDDDAQDRDVTGAELRWIYRNRYRPEVRAGVQFWREKTPSPPPLVTNARLWSTYVPKREPGRAPTR